VRRREVIALIGGATAAWPFAVRAQQPAMPVIGFLNGGSPEGYASLLAAFGRGLNEAGYAEGQNVSIEYRWAEGQYDSLPVLARELIARQVTVLVATSTPAALAGKAATATIPVVFTTSGDPVKLGLVSNLARPDGNVTGATQLNVEVAPKRLELLHEMLPGAMLMAVLVNPTNPTAAANSQQLETAARSLGVKLHVLHASTDHDLANGFETLTRLGIRALVIVSGDPFFTSRRLQLAALTLRHSIAAAYQYREFALGGGLVSYGGSIVDTYRLAGVYTGRILKGEKPAELPVVQSTKLELIINLRTAKALGLTVSLPLLGRADEVIE